MRTSMIFAVIVLAGCSDDNNTVDQGTDLLHTTDLARFDGPLDTMNPDQSKDPADVGAHEAGTDLGITCTATVGAAQVSGTVQGQAVTATHAGGVAVSLMGVTGFGVALLDQGGTCAGLSGIIGAPKLWILLCDNTPGTRTIGTSCISDASVGVSFKNQATIPLPGSDPKATGGTVTITAFDGTCGAAVKGSFSLKFGTDTVTGSFDTVGCGTIGL